MQPAGIPHGDAHVPVDTDGIVGSSTLLGEMRDHIRCRHYGIRSEQACLSWAKRYILLHGERHPDEMGGVGVEMVAFLKYLAVTRNVAATTQNQALSAVVFLYEQDLGRDEDLDLENIAPTEGSHRLPTVFDRSEVDARTTMIYTHVMNKGPLGVKSPLTRLAEI